MSKMKESPTNIKEMIEWLEMVRDYGLTIDGDVKDDEYIKKIIEKLKDYEELKIKYEYIHLIFTKMNERARKEEKK